MLGGEAGHMGREKPWIEFQSLIRAVVWNDMTSLCCGSGATLDIGVAESYLPIFLARLRQFKQLCRSSNIDALLRKLSSRFNSVSSCRMR